MDRLYTRAAGFERGVLEMEQNLRTTGRVHGHGGGGGPGLEALAAALNGEALKHVLLPPTPAPRHTRTRLQISLHVVSCLDNYALVMTLIIIASLVSRRHLVAQAFTFPLSHCHALRRYATAVAGAPAVEVEGEQVPLERAAAALALA